MSLIEKIFREEEPFIPVHDFGAILRMAFLGLITPTAAITAVETMLTRSNNGVSYQLTAAERTQLANAKAHYDGKILRLQQDHLDVIHSILILAANGRDVYLSEQQLVAIVGF
jgi:hypothetical protein